MVWMGKVKTRCGPTTGGKPFKSDQCHHLSRVASWHILKPKIIIWVNFGGSCKGRYWNI
jgi:hypothetical protein